MVNKYVKRPVIIEAIEFDGTQESKKEIMDWSEGNVGKSAFTHELFVQTLEGFLKIQNGDFVIKGIKGEFYPCKPDFFHATYDRIEDLINNDEG